MGSTWVAVFHAVTQGVVEQDGDLARRRSDRFGFADARRKASVEGPQRGLGAPDGDRGQPQQRRGPADQD